MHRISSRQNSGNSRFKTLQQAQKQLGRSADRIWQQPSPIQVLCQKIWLKLHNSKVTVQQSIPESRLARWTTNAEYSISDLEQTLENISTSSNIIYTIIVDQNIQKKYPGHAKICQPYAKELQWRKNSLLFPNPWFEINNLEEVELQMRINCVRYLWECEKKPPCIRKLGKTFDLKPPFGPFHSRKKPKMTLSATANKKPETGLQAVAAQYPERLADFKQLRQITKKLTEIIPDFAIANETTQEQANDCSKLEPDESPAVYKLFPKTPCTFLAFSHNLDNSQSGTFLGQDRPLYRDILARPEQDLPSL